MSNQYLVECHAYITNELNRAAERRLAAAEKGDTLEEAFWDGQVAELSDIRKFISAHFDLLTQRYY
jgi:hypothetical protein